MKRTFRNILAGSTALAISAAAWPVMAQVAAAPPPAPAKPAVHGLEEIVVTAQRVARNLQKTPVAVTSLSATALKDRGVTNILELNALAPNVSIGTASGSSAAAGDITIRGIGVNANPPASPAVGIYIDDVYFPGSFGNLLGLFDVSRVELLRGPQGTLFGRNTIAGAIQYVTVKPALDKFSGYVEDTVGNLSRNDVSAGINVPLAPIAALRVEGAITDRNGYVHDNLNDVDRGADRMEQMRVQLRVEPSSDLTIDLKYEYLDEHSNGGPTITTEENYNAILGALYGPHGPFGPNGLNRYISPNDYTDIGLNGADFSNTRFHIAQAVIGYKLTDDMTLKSISAYSSNTSEAAYDGDGTPLAIFDANRGDITDQLFTQEEQLSGRFLSGRLHYTIGAYYYDDHSVTLNQNAEIFNQLSFPFGDYTNLTESYAFYGQATYDLTSRLSVTAGLRFTAEKATAGDSLLPPGDSQRTFRDTSPAFGLNYQLTSNIFLYLKESRGFRAGGYTPTGAENIFFSPEHATTFEAGARMEFLGERLRINPSIFLTNWDNIQFNGILVSQALRTTIPIIENAGNAQIKGAEVETQAQVTDNFSVNANLSLLNGYYTTIAPSQRQLGDLTLGSGLARSPQSAFGLGGRYVLPLGDQRTLTFSTNYAWQAHQRSETSDGDNVPIPAYGLLSARAEFKPFGPRLSLSLFGTNLTGVKYFIGGTDYGNGGLIPATLVDIGPPREYGFTARYNF